MQYLSSDCRDWKEPRSFGAPGYIPLEPSFIRDSGHLGIFMSGLARDKAYILARNALMVQAGTRNRAPHSVSPQREPLALPAGPSQADAALPTPTEAEYIAEELEPVAFYNTDAAGGPPSPPRVSRFYRYMVPFLGFVSVVAILVTVYLTRTTYLSFVIVFPVILAIAIQRHLYKLRMGKLAEGVIAEAEYIKRFYPEAYPQYVDEAKTALRDHGVGALAARLPAR
jgi:hypothetical protein